MARKLRNFSRKRLCFISFSLLLLAVSFHGRLDNSAISVEITGSNAVDSKLGKLDNEIQRARVYAAYHEGRKDRCDGCRYVPFYERMYPNAKSVFDAGAANCGVMRLLEAKGFEVEGIEFSEWVVKKFCQDFLLGTERVQIGPIQNATITGANRFDLVLCTDVLEHIPIRDIPDTLNKISDLAKPGGSVFLVIASDPSKHENHPERSSAATELERSGMKIHETLKPRSWWLHELLKNGLEEDEQTMRVFFENKS